MPIPITFYFGIIAGSVARNNFSAWQTLIEIGSCVQCCTVKPMFFVEFRCFFVLVSLFLLLISNQQAKKRAMRQKRSFQMRGTLDGGLSWFVVLGSFMTQFVVIGIHNVFGLLYLDLLTEFQESKATTGKRNPASG